MESEITDLHASKFRSFSKSEDLSEYEYKYNTANDQIIIKIFINVKRRKKIFILIWDSNARNIFNTRHIQ